MSTNAVAGIGTLFKRGDGASSEAFTTIAECFRIAGPGMNRQIIECTSFDSAAGFREFITGLRDGGNLTVDINFTQDGYNDLLTDYNNDDPVNYQIVLPDTAATTLDFAGYVVDLPTDIPFDDKITMSVSIKVTGGVTLTS